MAEQKARINRYFGCEIRAEENEERGKYITGQPIVYGSTYDNGVFVETIDAGALDAADLKDVRLLVNHDMSMIPLARSRNNNANSTMQLEITESGLSVRADLDTENNATAEALYSAVGRGDISGMSFCFTVNTETWTDLDSDTPVRHITGIDKVFEVSAVTMPAYDATTIEARAADAAALESARAALESARADEAAKVEERVKELINRLKSED